MKINKQKIRRGLYAGFATLEGLALLLNTSCASAQASGSKLEDEVNEQNPAAVQQDSFINQYYALSQKAELQINSGDYSDAMGTLEDALILYDQNPRLQSQIESAVFKRDASALAGMKRRLSESEQMPQDYRERARKASALLYLSIDDYATAQEMYTATPDILKDSFEGLARTYSSNGEYKKAAKTYMAMGDEKSAIMMRLLDQTSEETFRNMIEWDMILKRWDVAEMMARIAIEVHQNEPEELADYYVILGKLYDPDTPFLPQERHNQAEAVSLYKKAEEVRKQYENQ